MRYRNSPRACAGLCLAIMLPWLPIAAYWCGVSAARDRATTVKRALSYSDLSAEVRALLQTQGVTDEGFPGYIAELDRKTALREIDGEYDHLIFFLLQSGRFTTQPRIEPANSALEFVRGLSAAEKSRYLAGASKYLPPGAKLPKAVLVRQADFIKAVKQGSVDERIDYFRAFLGRTITSDASLAECLFSEYARAMRFLYQKEFALGEVGNPEEQAAYVASLYRDRGHSTDTQVEANFALHIALSALKAQWPAARLDSVLIVGPGLDFAPRTDLMDLFGPQSYQPFAVADALIGLKLSDAEHLRVHCVDINERVVAHLRGLSGKKEVRISLVSGVGDSATRTLTGEYKDYFGDLGRSIGSESALEVPGKLAAHLRKTLRVRPEIVARISADRLNVITERYTPTPGYDLVVVTNVFPYFSQAELILALANIEAMMKEGGYLIHNELQTVPGSFTSSAGLPLEHARTVLIAASKGAPLFDGVAIHRKVKR